MLPPPMDLANMPLHSEHLDLDQSTLEIPRNFSKPFSAQSPPSTPRTTFDEDYDRPYRPSFMALSELDNRYLRRKPSRHNLSAPQHTAVASQKPSIRVMPFAVEPDPSLHAERTLLPPFQATSPKHAAAVSPSLSSTSTTAQSTPTQTPRPFYGSDILQRRDIHDSDFVSQDIRTKRKFSQVKYAKRLPRRAEGGWFVYAAVIGDYENVGDASETDIDLIEETEHSSRGKRRARPAKSDERRYDMSARFGGIWSEIDTLPETSESSEERDSIGDPAATLSNFRLPTAPDYTWAGTFGHLSEPIPHPTTNPATLQYEGASFDLVNPHASLLLGAKNIEAPAEMDSLFEDNLHTTYDADMAYRMISGTPSGSFHPNITADRSRQRRTLSSGASSGRRSIMHMPGTPSQPVIPEIADQESPLAHKSHDPDALLPLSTAERFEEVVVPTTTVEDTLGIDQPSPLLAEYGSTICEGSAYSEPFEADRMLRGIGDHAQYGERHLAGDADEYEGGDYTAVSEEGANSPTKLSLSSHSSHFHFMTALTSCFLRQECMPSRKQYYPRPSSEHVPPPHHVTGTESMRSVEIY